MNRREFLQRSGLGLLAWSLPHLAVADAAQETALVRLLSCHSNAQGQHFVSRIDPPHGIQYSVLLPERGHGLALHPYREEAVVFARRPGSFFRVFSVSDGTVLFQQDAPSDRHYYGHGVFSRDGSRLYVTENDFENGRGVIGVYAADQGYRRIHELDSHGVGPHEIKLHPDGETLIVANGGILTHPDQPRVKLNLDTMQPNLSYIDRHQGVLREQVTPPKEWHQLSMRHLDVAEDGTVAVVMQYQGDLHDQPPLIAVHRERQDLQLLSAPGEIQRQMKNYCGSVVFSADGLEFAVSSPRGALVTRWSATGEYLAARIQPDACGLAAADAGFWISDGRGQLVWMDRQGPVQHVSDLDTRWDNHMLRVPTAS